MADRAELVEELMPLGDDFCAGPKRVLGAPGETGQSKIQHDTNQDSQNASTPSHFQFMMIAEETESQHFQGSCRGLRSLTSRKSARQVSVHQHSDTFVFVFGPVLRYSSLTPLFLLSDRPLPGILEIVAPRRLQPRLGCHRRQAPRSFGAREKKSDSPKNTRKSTPEQRSRTSNRIGTLPPRCSGTAGPSATFCALGASNK